MKLSFRTVFASLLMGGALVTAAAAPGPAAERPLSAGDFAGTWITWWDEGGATSACSRVYVAAEDEATLDGMWAAPGLNGVMNGGVTTAGEGLRWQGEWRDAEGGSGGFRFILAAPGEFRGTYTVAGGADELVWNGARELPGEPLPEVPCSFGD